MTNQSITARISELEREFRAAVDGRALVDVRNRIAWALQTIDPERGLNLASESLNQSQSLNYSCGTAHALNTLARLYWIRGRYDDARTHAEQALPMVEQLGEMSPQSSAMITLGLIAINKGDLGKAMTSFMRALELSRSCNDQLNEADALRMIGNTNRQLGNNAVAQDCFTQSLAIAESAGDDYMIGSILHGLGMTVNTMGDPGNALDCYQRAAEAAERSGSLNLQAICGFSIGVMHVNRGEYQQALEQYRHSMELFERLGNRNNLARTLHNMGVVFEQLGDNDAALQHWLKSATLLEVIGDRIALADTLQGIGASYLAMNITDKALEYFQRSLALSRESSYKDGEGRALRMIGEVHEKTGDLDNAESHFRQSIAVNREIGNRKQEAECLHQLGEALALAGRKPEALEYYRKSLDISQELGTPYLEVITRVRLGELLSADSAGHQEALEYLNQALTISEENSTKPLIYQAHKVLAGIHRDREEYSQAFEHLQLFHEVKEDVFNDESDKRMKNLAVQFEVEKKEREAEIHRLKNVELVQLNDDLREANRVKNEFLRVAAHDLKNPLAGIMLMSELSMGQLEMSSPVATASKRIHESSERMLEIVNKLLDVAKLESGAIQIRKEAVDMSELVIGSVNQNREQAERKSQRIELKIKPGCVVSGDRGWLEESVENLVSNAIKYSEQGKLIGVVVVVEGEWVRVSVRDEGPGLSQEDKKKLFGTFQRLSAKPTGGESSTGLGLSITKQLVELHGGRIEVKSELGMGSEFVIVLPKYARSK